MVWDGILPSITHQITFALVEGLDSVVQLLDRYWHSAPKSGDIVLPYAQRSLVRTQRLFSGRRGRRKGNVGKEEEHQSGQDLGR